MKRPKGMLLKTLQRCRKGEGAAGVAPEGCLVVRVGPERERFVIRARWVNHPLFRGLLEEAERELGYGSGAGPLELPCEVEVFAEVVREVEEEEVEARRWCSFGRGAGGGVAGYRRV
ncbi:hypothetical protein ZIOFF_037497 [Zingiber officinale]|uniref:Uncharacterized protein n=1 Tax=Zingiber officinale TaxID=94328 RepID=A0A8J5L3G7_ZINOF|nr:hypothetical protein ZIOFF_037497 [Zingiber officinale]